MNLDNQEREAALYLLRSCNQDMLKQLFDGSEQRTAENAVYKLVAMLEDATEKEGAE